MHLELRSQLAERFLSADRLDHHLQLVSLKKDESEIEIDVNMNEAIRGAAFRSGENTTPLVVDIFWPREELYREVDEDTSNAGEAAADDDASNEVDANEGE
jgi:hypothetical protein